MDEQTMPVTSGRMGRPASHQDLARGQRIKQVRTQARLTQEKFARSLGEIRGQHVTRGAVANWERGAGIHLSSLRRIAQVYRVAEAWLWADDLSYQHTTHAGAESVNNVLEMPTASPNVGYRAFQANIGASAGPINNNNNSTVPLRGYSMAGAEGVLIMDPDANLGRVPAHPAVQGIPDAYALYVVGDSMLDRYAHGDTVYVDPRKPPHRGSYVVAQIAAEREGDPDMGFIKRFVSNDGRTLKLEQLNPRQMMAFPVGRVRSVHLIVGTWS
jgi:transcriptional regulator with XRE-family HTH domain